MKLSIPLADQQFLNTEGFPGLLDFVDAKKLGDEFGGGSSWTGLGLLDLDKRPAAFRSGFGLLDVDTVRNVSSETGGGTSLHPTSAREKPDLPEIKKLPPCNDPRHNRSRFFEQQPMLDALAKRLDVPRDYLTGLASFESDWLDDHNYGLNNIWGLTKAGKNNLSYPSLQAGTDYFEKRVGPYISSTKTVPDFLAGLRKEGYNSVNPAYDATLANRIQNIAKWRAACGVD